MNSKTKTYLINAVFLTISLVITLVVLELAFRLLSPKKRIKRWNDRPLHYFVSSDAQNMQDKMYPAKKEPGVFRVVVVGDSFTFGPYLQLDDTFPKRMERWFNLNAQGRKVEVVNRGFSGFNTAKESEVVAKEIGTDPDLVILEITLNDGERGPLTREQKEQIFGTPWLKNGLFQYWKSFGFLLERFHNSQTHKAYIEYHTKFFKEPETKAVFEKALAKIADGAAAKNIPVIAMLFPLFDFPLDAKYPFEESHRIIHSVLEDIKIPYLDLFSAFHGIPHERLQVIPGVDSHPNEIAHRIAAERLAEFLKARKLIPAGVWPEREYNQRVNILEKTSKNKRKKQGEAESEK